MVLLLILYIGGEAGKVEVSCEKVAQKAIRDLMKKYGVYVEDVTSIKTKAFVRCAAIYSLKEAKLQCVDEGLPKIALHESLSNSVCNASKPVCIDFV